MAKVEWQLKKLILILSKLIPTLLVVCRSGPGATHVPCPLRYEHPTELVQLPSRTTVEPGSVCAHPVIHSVALSYI